MKTQKFNAKLIALLLQQQIAQELPAIALRNPKVIELLNKLQLDIQGDLKGREMVALDTDNPVQQAAINAMIMSILEEIILPSWLEISALIDPKSKISGRTTWKARSNTITRNAKSWIYQVKENSVDYSTLIPCLSDSPTVFEFLFRNFGLFGIADW